MAPRKKKETGTAIVEQNVRIITEKIVNDFLQDPEKTELQFPNTFTNAHRKYVHDYVKKFGLKSKSHGKGDTRILSVYKLSNNIDFAEDAELEVSENVSRRIFQLLKKCPVTQKERCDLEKPLVAERNNQKVFPFRFSIGSNYPNIPPYPMNLSSNIVEQRMGLPIFQYRDHIIHVINSNQAVVISGETGSGKTTQVPQYLLEYAAEQQTQCRIICTQPRRLSAVSVSERVCVERNEVMGATVGYQIRLESKMCPNTNLIYCTNGVLLRCLMTDQPEKVFENITHVVVDEVHERDKYSDFLLISLKRALIGNPRLKVILMSATIDAEVFTKYFYSCPLIEIPGKLYDVDINYLEDVLQEIGYTNDRIDELKRAKLRENYEMPSTSTSDPSDKLLSAIEAISMDDDTVDFTNEVLRTLWMENDEDMCDQFMHLVIEEGVEIDYKSTETDMNALMIAAGRGLSEFLMKLLERGADPTIKNVHNMTAYDIAVHTGQEECATILEQAIQTGKKEQKIFGTSDANKHILLEGYLALNMEDNIDHNLLFKLIRHIHHDKPEGSILVFLPGYADIIEQGEKIDMDLGAKNYRLFMLHSHMQTTDQKDVFTRMPEGVRKIILATNLAETSITIDDVVYVIDTGRVKQQTFDAISGSSCLAVCWTSKACAKQRAGRAGRCRNGVCYRMFSSGRFESMESYTLPELLRVPLTEICIQAKLIEKKLPIEKFLQEAIQPPSPYNISQSIKILQAIGALDDNENLTNLGIHLGDLPIEVRLGKMLLYSILLRCLDPVLTIVSALSTSDPFLLPSQSSERGKVMRIKHQFAEESFSDHLVLLRVFQRWSNEKNKRSDKKFCQQNYIRTGTMDTIAGVRTQLLGHLRSVWFVRNQGPGNIRDLNTNSGNWSMVKACIVAGLYPNIAHVDKKKTVMMSRNVSKMGIHMSSVLKHRTVDKKESFAKIPTDWIVYEEKVRVGRFCLSQTNTAVTPLTVALFTGPICMKESQSLVQCNGNDTSDSDVEDEEEEDSSRIRFILDDWLNFVSDINTAHLVFNLRQKLNALFLKILSDTKEFYRQELNNPVIKTLSTILLEEDKAHNLSELQGIEQRPRCLQINYEVRLQSGELLTPMNVQTNWRNQGQQQNGELLTPMNVQTNWRQQVQQQVDDVNVSNFRSVTKNQKKERVNRPIQENWREQREPKFVTNPKTSKKYGFQKYQQQNQFDQFGQFLPSSVVNPRTPLMRFFIVKAASREQVLQTIKLNQWHGSTSVRSQLIRILRQNPGTRIMIFFNIPLNKFICCLTELHVKNEQRIFQMINDHQYNFSYLRNIINGSGVNYLKNLDECLDGEELPFDVGKIFYDLFKHTF